MSDCRFCDIANDCEEIQKLENYIKKIESLNSNK